jgi:tetratricopeptide (TPR) repeat protein
MPDQPPSGANPEPAAAELEIRILPRQGAGDAYQVLARGSHAAEVTSEFRSPFTRRELDAALDALDAGSLGSVAIQRFGAPLFAALFSDPVRRLYLASHVGAQPPRIRLIVADAAAASIPWELMVDPDSEAPLVLRTRFVRGFSTEAGARPLLVAPPLRILVADSAPAGLEPLSALLEATAIEAALVPLVDSGRVEVRVVGHATYTRLQDGLRGDETRGPAHVLHWIGHGGVDRGSGSNVIALEDAAGGIDPLDGARFADLLANTEVRLVVLNACHTAAGSALGTAPVSSTAAGIAESLLAIGVPALVGMRVSIGDDHARTFATGLYESLADGVPIDGAVHDARRAISAPRARTRGEPGIPVFYLRGEAGRLLERPRHRRTVGMAVAAIVAICVTLVLALAIFPPRPGRMTGTLNVVVTEFAELGPNGALLYSDPVTNLSMSFAGRLRDELSTLAPASGIQVRSPDQTDRLAGATAETRAVAAAALAERIGAHVVVSAVVDGTNIQPEFYVHDRELPGAEELEGRFRLGAPIEQLGPLDSIAVSLEAQQDLIERTQALSQIVIGLSYFAIERYPDAESYFMAAESRLHDPDWQEVVQLFLGTTAGQDGRYPDARERYESALRSNPDFARARLGLAEVRLQEAKQRCEPGAVDAGGLMEAEALFRAALEAPDQPASAHVPEKVRFGIARVAICASQGLGAGRWDEARGELDAIIAAFAAGDTTLETLAGQAHELKALTLLPAGPDVPDAAGAYEAALAEYDAALALDGRSVRTARYHAGRAHCLNRLGRLEDARAAYQDAIARAKTAESRAEYQRLLDDLGAPSGSLPGPASIAGPDLASATEPHAGRWEDGT